MAYDIILADPPWRFESWTAAGTGRSAEQHYPTMHYDELAKLHIPRQVNQALFLWAVWPMLSEALDLIGAWGFSYRTIAWVWIKAKSSGFGFHTGLGYYTRANTEPCLLAVRGKMPVARHDIQALIYAPVKEHSRKPADQYRKIEALYPDCSYLELFARQKRDGWDAWGNEVESDIHLR